MKKAKKALALVLCAVLLVAGSVMGTLAYLTSTDTVTNTFTVGNVAITLDETDANTDGTANPAASSRVQANEYHLLPGHRYIKDPTIHVDANSEDCYLFVKVENGISSLEAATDSKSGTKTIADQLTANGWMHVDGVDNVYVYTYNETKHAVSGGENVKVFDYFIINGEKTGDQIAAIAGKDEDNAEIKVTAYAIQKDGFESQTAEAIWTASGFGTSGTGV